MNNKYILKIGKVEGIDSGFIVIAKLRRKGESEEKDFGVFIPYSGLDHDNPVIRTFLTDIFLKGNLKRAYISGDEPKSDLISEIVNELLLTEFKDQLEFYTKKTVEAIKPIITELEKITKNFKN